jgi:hypothetical protein
LPWRALDCDTRLGGYVIDVDRQKLGSAPSFDAPETPWNDPDHGRAIYSYYNVP